MTNNVYQTDQSTSHLPLDKDNAFSSDDYQGVMAQQIECVTGGQVTIQLTGDPADRLITLIMAEGEFYDRAIVRQATAHGEATFRLYFNVSPARVISASD